MGFELVLIDEDMQSTAVMPVSFGVVTAFSARSPLSEGANEDAAAILPVGNDAIVLVVADGTGGCRGGHTAAKLAVRALADKVKDCADARDLRDAILDGFEQANKKVCALGIGAATTLAALEVQGNRIRSYHVGDSLVLAFGQRGKIKHQTVSHSPVGYAIEAGVISEVDAISHRDRHIVSNLVGSENMRIEIGPTLDLATNDTVILASDGLTDNLQVSEIVENVRCGELPRGVESLIGTCALRMLSPKKGEPSKPDDVTVLAFRSSN